MSLAMASLLRAARRSTGSLARGRASLSTRQCVSNPSANLVGSRRCSVQGLRTCSPIVSLSKRQLSTEARVSLDTRSADLLAASNWAEHTCQLDATKLAPIQDFIESAIALCKPDAVHFVTGSREENQKLLDTLVENGTLKKLDEAKRPNSYAGSSDPDDVSRSMGDTLICSKEKKNAGPINNWVDPKTMKEDLGHLFDGCMMGRTMYISPFCMGPIESEGAKFCIQVTDSPYVVVHLRLTTRLGLPSFEKIVSTGEYIQCWHSVGRPLNPMEKGSEGYDKACSSWPCNIEKRKIVHFPESREVWSFGSGYGGNALLGKKCVALRIASVQGHDEGWLAEHMLILGITSPAGVKKYVCAAFPSACGKTNLSMMVSALPGWKVETVGDDISWLRFDKNGQLRAINPENGFFGVAPGTSRDTNPNAFATFAKNSIFTNVATTTDGDVYWEGLQKPDSDVTSWLGQEWDDSKEFKSSHPNSRFTAPLQQCPSLDGDWNNPNGVPIDAIVFGTRRDDTLPLVFETRDWEHGVFVGAAMRSNATSAAEQVGIVHDPMAMSPFIGYNVKDYFNHWLNLPKIGKKVVAGSGATLKLPKIFHVNWFVRNQEKKFVWPGFAHNGRVLAWICERTDNNVDAIESPIGLLPKATDIDTSDMESTGFAPSDLDVLLNVDSSKWEKEVESIKSYFAEDLMKGDDVEIPQALVDQLQILESNLKK